MRSEKEQRQQKTPIGADPATSAVNPRGSRGGLSSAAAQMEATSREESR